VPVIALEDSGAKIGMVDENLIKHLNLPVLGKILIRPVVGQTVEANLVPLRIKPHASLPLINIAPYVDVIVAVCPLATDVSLILSGSLVEQIRELHAGPASSVTEARDSDAASQEIWSRSD